MQKPYVISLIPDKDNINSTNEIFITKAQYKYVSELLEKNAKGMLNFDGITVNTASIKEISFRKDSYQIARARNDKEHARKAWDDFRSDEAEYRGEAPKEKAKRDYYTRFMGMVLSAYGLKKVLGNDYVSPATAKEAFGDGWEFTEEQRMDRRKRFDRWVENSNWPTLWGKDLKNFLVEYYEVNPDKSWCDLEEWWPFFVEGKLPTTKFDKVLIAHEKQTQNL